MSLLIKALQKAEQSKENAGAEKTAAVDGAKLELTPHHDDIDSDFSLADESGFHEPHPAKKAPAHEAMHPTATEHHSEREAAANVFRAHNDAVTDPGGRRAFWLGLGGLAFLLMLGIGFYFYLDTLQQPGMVMARTPRSQPIMPAAPPPAPVSAAQTTPAEPVVVSTAPATSEENAAQPDAAKPVMRPAPIVEKPLVAMTPAATRKMQQMADSEKPAVEVKRNHKSEPAIDATSMAAYQAYTAGDDAAAGRLYRQLLQSDSRNIDALLGLAAVAARQDNNDEAASYYARTLELEPKNSVAQAGLIALLGQADPVSAESRLKSLLAQQPDAAYLHAALGGIYAEQNQWPNAQQAYFQALRLDPGNAEHAFNLAVSLDQMSKPDLALDYYQRARDLLPGQGGSIDRNGLETRINQLRSTLGK
jgi:Tfp pilus assembly protein PilF